MESSSDIVSKQSENETNNIEPLVQHTIGGCSSIEEFAKNGLGLIMQATKCSNAFPSGPSRSLYSAFPVFNNIVDEQSDKILGIISNVIRLHHIKGNIQRRDNDEKFELLLECNDAMLERINSNLDDLAGIRKAPETVLVQTEVKTSKAVATTQSSGGSWNENKKPTPITAVKIAKLLTARNIVRPQINFKVSIDNSSLRPFEPRIKYKPNSLKPLAVLPEYGDDGSIISYLHPYEFELSKFTAPSKQLKGVDTPEPALPLEATPLIYVDSEAKLNNLVTDLSKENVIGVDLEHHSYRTFQGITCLMQISTRTKDYIIDTLTLRDYCHILNEVFTNAKVVKIFHGADSDIEWLQRDLSVYVVNMFDTHQAAKRLGLARLSLAFLLKQYCQLDADKTFQLADWRMRPLPDDLITYARQDTHYLLYIYDVMTNQLLQNANGKVNLLQSVYQASTEICKKKYIKPVLFPDSHTELYRKSKRVFDNRQLYALNAIYTWRDKIARQEDESYGYVLPNHMLLQIAEILPREMQGILACCNPIPPLVRQNLQVLHQFILKAREQPLVKPIPEELNTNRVSALNKNKDLSGLLFCPHDLSHNQEFRDDLPTLLSDKRMNFDWNLECSKMATKSALSIFDTPDSSENEDEIREKIRNITQTKFVSPYARYLSILPLAEQQRIEELAKQEQQNKKKRLCPEKNEPEEFILKQEPLEVNDNVNVPLKDVGKRKRNDNFKPAEVEESIKQSKKKFKNAPAHAEIGDHVEHLDDKEADGSIASGSTTLRNCNKVKKNRKNKNKLKNATITKQLSSKPVEFDYNQVNFKKFQGGSKGDLTKGNNLQTKFKGKGKGFRSNDKRFNKLLAFNKVQKKK